VEQRDARRTKIQLASLLNRYPPNLEVVLANDPTLLTNQSYLATYPELASFLNDHSDVARNPLFYFGDFQRGRFEPSKGVPASELWRSTLSGLAGLAVFGTMVAVVIWLIQTILDYRRWNRLSKIQTEVHTRLLERFTGNEELMAYIQTPAGKRFLESAPITLDGGSRSMSAPIGRILWSIQVGLVLAAGGAGMQMISGNFTDDVSQPLKVLGPLGIALGVGFLASATASYMISSRLGLIESATQPARLEPPH
jgi:hypothetical protein